MNEYMDISEVAELVGVHPITIRRWWLNGTIIPPVRLSKRTLRWHRRKLELWLQTRGGAPPERKHTISEIEA